MVELIMTRHRSGTRTSRLPTWLAWLTTPASSISSTSYIQRKLSVGYNKAAKLVEMMEDQGVVSQANHVGKREVLVAER